MLVCYEGMLCRYGYGLSDRESSAPDPVAVQSFTGMSIQRFHLPGYRAGDGLHQQCLGAVGERAGNLEFSSVNVVGNYFFPNQLGSNPVVFTYTDSLGCSASITKYINVIACCLDTCDANAGPDQVICAGQPLTLQTAGCDSTTWFEIFEGELQTSRAGANHRPLPDAEYLLCPGVLERLLLGYGYRLCNREPCADPAMAVFPFFDLR